MPNALEDYKDLMTVTFNPKCKKCPRLVAYLNDNRAEFPNYHLAPVAAFGDECAKFLIVGLAPGFHGANATGRPFTGDYSGVLLYQTLYDFGFSNQPESIAGDDLRLKNCLITNAVKCVPPANKPTTAEVRECNPYLKNELGLMPKGSVILALGRVAHDAIRRAFNLKAKDFPFSHGAVADMEERWLVASYHCSRYNTQTRRLTETMFRDVFDTVRQLLSQEQSSKRARRKGVV